MDQLAHLSEDTNVKWDDYRLAYRDFDRALVRGRFLGAATITSIRDFPNHLPHTARVGLQAGRDSVVEMIKEIADDCGLVVPMNAANEPSGSGKVVPIRQHIARAVESIVDEALREAAHDLYLSMLGQGQPIYGRPIR